MTKPKDPYTPKASAARIYIIDRCYAVIELSAYIQTMVLPDSLARDISPPPTRKPSGSRSSISKHKSTEGQAQTKCATRNLSNGPSLAAIEAGEAHVRDHLAYFSHHFRLTSRETLSAFPRINIDDFQNLYRRNDHPHGCHFVIHQHDHPISGNACE